MHMVAADDDGECAQKVARAPPIEMHSAFARISNLDPIDYRARTTGLPQLAPIGR